MDKEKTLNKIKETGFVPGLKTKKWSSFCENWEGPAPHISECLDLDAGKDYFVASSQYPEYKELLDLIALLLNE